MKPAKTTFPIGNRRRHFALLASALALLALAGDDYGIRNPSWQLDPGAKALLAEWGATPYARKNGRTDLFVRAQLKYGINRDDFIHHWYDRPLLQDSSLGQRQDTETETRAWLNPGSWKKTVEMSHLGKQAGFAVFTFTSRREEVIPLSVKPGMESTILVELARGCSLDTCLMRAGQALEMPNSYRLGGKVVLTSYPSVGEKDLPHYAELKRRLVEKFGDRFLLMPYFNLFADEPGKREPLTTGKLVRVRERLERALRTLDGLCYNGRESYFNRRYDPWLFDNVIVPVVRGVFAKDEFRGKYLGCWATPGHENSYRWNYGLDCTGTRMLRDTLSSIVKLSPDFVIGCEWDEENENTCFRPMVAHGFTHQRLMRHFVDTVNGRALEAFPGDDTSIPNLVLSYRKEIMGGEPLEVEVLNIPDGTFAGGSFKVSFAWKTPDGAIAKAFPAQTLSADKLAAAWFNADASALMANPSLVPSLSVTTPDGRERTYSDGFWPVGVRPSRCIEYKWTKQPLRELPTGVAGGISLGAKDEEGAFEVKGRVAGPRRFRSIAVLDETDTVYMYDGEPVRDADMVRVRIAFQGYALNGKNHDLKGRISLSGAPGAKLSISRARGNIEIKGMDFVFSGAMLNNWPHYLFVDIPKAEAANARFTADISGFFEGEVSVGDLLEREVIGLPGPKGGNLVFTRFRSQQRIPVPQNVSSAEFSFRLKPGLPRSILRLETVDEDYRVWRSKPFVCGSDTGVKVPFHVYERDADRVSSVTVDSSRVLKTEYSFEPSRGSVVSCAGGRNLWGILGGCVPLVTGFGQGESGYGNSGALAVSKKTVGWEKSSPEYVRESDGEWALKFSGCSYASLPQQIWPVEAGFALEMRVNPDDVQRKQGLLTTGGTSSGIYIDKGRVYAHFFLRNKFMRESGRAASVTVPGPEIAAGRWQTVRVVCDQRTAWVEVDGAKGEPQAVSGDLFYPLYTALGAGTKPTEFFAGRIKSLSIGLR